jgi:hypothetical protein
MRRHWFFELCCGGTALIAATTGDLPAAEPAAGLTGNYGFLSCAVLGSQSEAAIRERVAIMARQYGIREFQFYDWFTDYSTPVAGECWTDPYFRQSEISRRTIEISIDEVHRQGGRAWAYVQAVAAEESTWEDPARDMWKLRDGRGAWYWHPPGQQPGRFPTYFPNAAWAAHMVEHWAGPVKVLGFDGIHWDTLGRLAGDYASETAGIHAFLQTAHAQLQRLGLRQTMNMVDLAWWDRDVVRSHLEFPYAETWSTNTLQRYFAEMDQADMAGIRGVVALYPTVAVPPGATATDVICSRWNEARRHQLVYLIVGDGARRMKNEYWPGTVPLTAAESACLQGSIPLRE